MTDAAAEWDFEPDEVTMPGVKQTAALPADETSALGAVLVVDSDRVTRRFVELALAAMPEVRVIGAACAAEAFEVLRTVPVEAILAASRLQDGDGLGLLRRVRQRTGAEHVPFVVLSGDQRPASKVTAFGAGVDDYLVKPCDPAELVARLRAQIERARTLRAARAGSSSALAGDFSALPFADLVAMLELGARTGTVAIATNRTSAKLFVENGRVVHVVHGSVTGVAAFVRLLAEPRGNFEVTLGPTGLGANDHTITMGTTSLILESARILDEERRAGRASLSAAPPRPAVRQRAALPSPELIERYIYDLGDGWGPGELELLDADRLEAWGLASRTRYLSVLFADLRVGVGAMLAEAAPPEERELIAALRGGPLVLTMTMRHRDRQIAIVLVDMERPNLTVGALVQAPALAVIASPSGDLRALSATARVELDVLMGQLSPAVVLGVGHDNVEDMFRTFGSLRRGGTVATAMTERLGVGGVRLRETLLRGLRTWVDAGRGRDHG